MSKPLLCRLGIHDRRINYRRVSGFDIVLNYRYAVERLTGCWQCDWLCIESLGIIEDYNC